MNINEDLKKIAILTPLYLEVAYDAPLSELTTQLNNLCVEAERQISQVVVLYLNGETNNHTEPFGEICVQQISRWEKAVRRLEKTASIVMVIAIGIIDGWLLDILLASDYRIAFSNSKLCFSVNHGQVWPGMAIHRLVNQVGVALARKMIICGQEVQGKKALDMGLVDDLTDDIIKSVQKTLSKLRAISHADVSILRQLLLEAPAVTFEEALGTHLATCDREIRRLQTCAVDDKSKELLGESS